MRTEELDRVVMFVDANGDIRWNYRAAGNEEKLADGSQGYNRDDIEQVFTSCSRVVNRVLVTEGEALATSNPKEFIEVELRDGLEWPEAKPEADEE